MRQDPLFNQNNSRPRLLYIHICETSLIIHEGLEMDYLEGN